MKLLRSTWTNNLRPNVEISIPRTTLHVRVTVNHLIFHRVFWLCYLRGACPTLQLSLVSPTAAADAETSQFWGMAGERWEANGRLPDFSYAGNHRGERPQPERRPDCGVVACTSTTK
ncbi:MAG: hypothetical protein H6823_03890 [Planctomycetaceae bacterium]|nr:hypothetical protein [Planctomycetales bacterium]MCB9937357.1 hypothetical protein [Planctomycetaceae bacterium]